MITSSSRDAQKRKEDDMGRCMREALRIRKSRCLCGCAQQRRSRKAEVLELLLRYPDSRHSRFDDDSASQCKPENAEYYLIVTRSLNASKSS